jgi:ATP-dependent DNA helicase RecQ
MRDKLPMTTATIAFGMGVDKPNIRFVVHWNLPKNIENYYQETGRAGRDGLPSQALLFYDPKDASTLRNFIWQDGEKASHLEADAIKFFRQVQEDKLDRLLEFCQTATCRRRVLLNYFDEDLPQDCGYCDACDHPKTKFDGTAIAQKIISAIYRTGQNFPSSYIVNLLQGKVTPTMRQQGHQQLPTFGVGQELSATEWEYYVNQLLDLGYLKISYRGMTKILVLTSKVMPVIHNQETLELVQYETHTEKESASQKSLQLDPLQEKLLSELKQLRKDLADERQAAAFTIFSDATLVDMLRQLPTTLSKFIKVSGVGESKRDKFGEKFTQLIADFCRKNPELKPLRRQVSTGSNQKSGNTYQETLRLWKTYRSVSKIAEMRKMRTDTVATHLLKLVENEQLDKNELQALVDEEVRDTIREEKSKGFESQSLREWKEIIRDKYELEVNYTELKLALILEN